MKSSVIQDSYPGLKKNIRHLYLDIAWFGLLNGSAVAFISVYMVRIGASVGQIGMLNAGPTLVAMLLSVPAGNWLKNRRLDSSVFWTSLLFRGFYLLWILLPVFFSANGQIQLILISSLVMSIPGTTLAVGFNALFADAIPVELRGRVVGVRNALLAVTYIITSLSSGYMLEHLPFPLNYQLVFSLGVIGALMSSYHLFRLRSPNLPPANQATRLGDQAQPGFSRLPGDGRVIGVALRYLRRRNRGGPRNRDIVFGPFGPVLLALFAFHLAQYLAIPLFPIFWVENLGLSDQEISLGNSLFFAAFFLGSTRLAGLIDRWGNHRVTVLGVFLMSGYPFLTGITRDLSLFLVTSIYGGAAWSLAGGALGNYLLEIIPAGERPAYLGWYMVVMNAAALLGSLTGPFLAGIFGIIPTLFLVAFLRLASTAGIEWIKPRPAVEAGGPGEALPVGESL